METFLNQLFVYTYNDQDTEKGQGKTTCYSLVHVE